MGEREAAANGEMGPVLVATDVTYCIVHRSTDCEGKKWTACRFRQLFYFEDPMDEHTVLWSDEIAASSSGSEIPPRPVQDGEGE